MNYAIMIYEFFRKGFFMKILKQILILFSIYFLGVILAEIFNLSIPGSIIGMLILLISLITGIIKLEDIKEVSEFMLDNLALFFIPSGVGIITIYDSIEDKILQIMILCIATTIIVMVITALTVKFIRKFINEKEDKNE